ncbi:MAG TPA: transketolase C-terminal domain-containing protein [Candidatus Acidoferrales bacterium]|nr:transketolase C-terminal domain-containing protein [Candidatus Acidoferrales bacterium]
MTGLLAQRDSFGDTMIELCDRDPLVVLLDGDLANSTKSDKLAVARPDRFFMMGIAEQNLVGVAAGMATVGLKPWVASFAAFIATRDLDQVRVVVAQPKLNVKLAAHYSGILTGYTGKTHQVVNDIAIMRSFPNMVVVAPCDAVEARSAMLALNEYDGPVYLRLTRDPSPVVTPENYAFSLGRTIELRSGTDIALVTTGAQTLRALEAAGILAADRVSAAVLHVPTIKPLDEAAIVAVAKKVRCILTCEEHSIFGGLGGAVAEVLGKLYPARVDRLGLRDVDGESAPNDALIEKYGLSSAAVAQRAKDLIASL